MLEKNHPHYLKISVDLLNRQVAMEQTLEDTIDLNNLEDIIHNIRINTADSRKFTGGIGVHLANLRRDNNTPDVFHIMANTPGRKTDDTKELLKQDIQKIIRTITIGTPLPLDVCGYLALILRPYIHVLNEAMTSDQIRAWLSLVFDEPDLGKLRQEMSHLHYMDAAEARTIIETYLTSKIMGCTKIHTLQFGVINPWTVARARDDSLIKLFGPAHDTIMVDIRYGTGEWRSHEISEELMAGLLASGLLNDKWSFVINGVAVTRNVHEFYQLPRGSQYNVTIGDTKYYFDTPAFMQGVSTACNWSGIKINKIVTKLQQRSENGTITELAIM